MSIVYNPVGRLRDCVLFTIPQVHAFHDILVNTRKFYNTVVLIQMNNLRLISWLLGIRVEVSVIR